jgi:hypothetical protein
MLRQALAQRQSCHRWIKNGLPEKLRVRSRLAGGEGGIRTPDTR